MLINRLLNCLTLSSSKIIFQIHKKEHVYVIVDLLFFMDLAAVKGA